jgi:hypothetical protein
MVIPSPAVLRIMRVTGVDTVLRIYPSLDAAVGNAAQLALGRTAGPPAGSCHPHQQGFI